MNITKLFFKPAQAGLALSAGLILTLTGCVASVDGPSAGVAVESPGIVAPDDYLYYPSYGVYYSSSRHQYASLQGGAWVSEPAPRGVSVGVLTASPSVRMDFHDSPANHHATVVRQYPKTWKQPARSNQKEEGGRGGEHAAK